MPSAILQVKKPWEKMRPIPAAPRNSGARGYSGSASATKCSNALRSYSLAGCQRHLANNNPPEMVCVFFWKPWPIDDDFICKFIQNPMYRCFSNIMIYIYIYIYIIWVFRYSKSRHSIAILITIEAIRDSSFDDQLIYHGHHRPFFRVHQSPVALRHGGFAGKMIEVLKIGWHQRVQSGAP